MDSEKKKKIKIIVLSILLAIVVISIIVFASILIIKQNRNNDTPTIDEPQENNSQGTDIFTNSYNEAISKRILTTYNYSGTYEFEESVYIYFNEYSESNPNGLTQTEINQIMLDKGCTNLERNEFRKIIDREKAQSTSGETITISKPFSDQTGTNESFGYYVVSNPSGNSQGKVYGDENLAVIVKDSDESVYTFISLNYKKMSDAVSVADSKETLDGKIYVFENTYDSNGRLLYSITYTYKIVKTV